MVDRVRPDLVEHMWAEPFNDRHNWVHVRAGYAANSFGYKWFTDVYERGHKDRWSDYATELYLRLRNKARAERWIDKLRYLLYELDITEEDANRFGGLEGVMLQSKPGEDGRSANVALARYQ